MLTMRKSSVFPAERAAVFARLQRLKTLQHIAYPMATFQPVDGNEELIWEPGTASSFAFRLFGVIPFGVHTIKVLRFGLEEGILTQESNKHVPVWNHEIVLEQTAENTTRYTDIVEIDAGWKTLFVYLWAHCFYAHRQRRWRWMLKNEA